MGCSSSPAATPIPATTATPIRGGIFSTATPQRATSPAALATSTQANKYAEIVLRWDAGTKIADIDDVSEIAIRLRDRPGIVDAFGDEIQITITYDPLLIKPEQVQNILRDMGYPTKKP